MKTTLILVVSVLLAGCAVGSFPKFPEKVTNQYTLDIRNQPIAKVVVKTIVNIEEIEPWSEDETQVVRCLKFDIVSQAPWKIKYVGMIETAGCNGLTGFKPADAQTIYNWIDDVYEWAKDRKKCFK